VSSAKGSLRVIFEVPGEASAMDSQPFRICKIVVAAGSAPGRACPACARACPRQRQRRLVS
jgi:hypothetical protein